MNTWIKNPQDPADEHDWTQWFADPKLFRNVDLSKLEVGDE